MFDSRDKTQEGRTEGRLRVMEAHGVDPRGTAPPYLRQPEKIMSMSELFTHPVWFKSKRGKKETPEETPWPYGFWLLGRIIDLHIQANLSDSVGQVPVKHSLCSSIC